MSMVPATDDPWVVRFHAGGRQVQEECYRTYFGTVSLAVRRILQGADAETAIHEVFYRLISRPEMRASFAGGEFAAWIHRVATHVAIDHRRRYSRESELTPQIPEPTPSESPIDAIAAKDMVDRFRREKLPAKWARVFEARFLRQLPQREAAASLGMSRTTLVYQEQRVRELFRTFVLKEMGK